VTLTDLRRVLPPPAKPTDTGSPAAWRAVEAALGVRYPPDFRDLIATYGSGMIDGVIALLNPIGVDWTGAPPFASLPRSLGAVLGALNPNGAPRDVWLYALASTLAASDGQPALRLPDGRVQTPARLWPESPGLFPWARGDSGQALLWWTEGAPEQWPVVLADPSEGFLSYDMDATGVLAGWLAGTVKLDYLPSPTKPRFRPSHS
jgi:hypothetical protein